MSASLRTRFFWALFPLFLVLVAGIGGALWRRAQTQAVEHADGELLARAHALANLLEPQGEHFDLELPDEFVRLQVEYAIWDRRGAIVDRSLDAPRPDGPGARWRGDRREVAVSGPRDALILVGARPDLSRVATDRTLVILGGALVLVIVALLAALVSRFVTRPVALMSATAAAISASDLSGRIDTSKTVGELKQLAETLNGAFDRLEAAMDQQARFTADASHELRTPLAILLSQTELALRKDRSADEYREAIEACHRAAIRMTSVVESLLTLARVDAKELAMARERLDLKPIVEETVAVLRPMAAKRNVTVSVAAAPCEITGDRERLRDVITNLVTNAIRYNKPNGRVDVALQGGVLTVADTGVGIPEKDRPHIFERFYRVDKARSRELGGTGLGLAIAKGIVEAHGGTIAFTSRDGEGTTFTVIIRDA